jgi:SAM-dependent methyltransferase
VLDVGSGDGRLARLVADKRPDISIHGMDVCPRTDAAIPVETFNGRSIPYGEGNFDVVMFIDVLHHTAEPMILLGEAVRVARQVIPIKDHLLKGSVCLTDPAIHGLGGKCASWCCPTLQLLDARGVAACIR